MSDVGPLLPLLERSRALGFLGPGPVEDHVAHTQRLVAVLAEHAPRQDARAADLGSGGGVPGLIAAWALPRWQWCLIDANERRTAFLADAVATLAAGDRMTVRRERAESSARTPELRGAFDVVTARSFGPPAVTAECGAPLLRVGGVLVVSEPPDPVPGRWSADGLQRLGFDPEPVTTGPWVAFRLVREVPDEFPRRVGRPGKRPLWVVP